MLLFLAGIEVVICGPGVTLFNELRRDFSNHLGRFALTSLEHLHVLDLLLLVSD